MPTYEGSPRSAEARAAAEQALVAVAHQYGGIPPFVLLGGLVPGLLCSNPSIRHAGTTDVDVQVDLEFQSGFENSPRLERALKDVGFAPDKDRIWRWMATTPDGRKALIKFELLTDRADQPANATLIFPGCVELGAANLRGTKYASQDATLRNFTARYKNQMQKVQVNVTGLAGFLLAKLAAAYGRQKPKDWYDIAFVLLYNDEGGIGPAVDSVNRVFPGVFEGTPGTWLRELSANFADNGSQGMEAFVDQMLLDHPQANYQTLRADAHLAVSSFAESFLKIN